MKLTILFALFVLVTGAALADSPPLPSFKRSDVLAGTYPNLYSMLPVTQSYYNLRGPYELANPISFTFFCAVNYYNGQKNTSFTANPSASVTSFWIGYGGACTGPTGVSYQTQAYLSQFLDLYWNETVPGGGTWLQLNWLFDSVAYERRDQWEVYCDSIQIEINPELGTGPAPC